MILKAQDSLLALKYWSLRNEAAISNVRAIAESIGISAGEVSKGSKRLMLAHLLIERDGKLFIEINGLIEWYCYGIRYAYPQEIIGYGRGMGTSWNCPVLKSEMTPPQPALVWALPGGAQEGAIIKPIHESVPKMAQSSDLLYKALSLLEAIRGGKPRELAIARNLLQKLLKD